MDTNQMDGNPFAHIMDQLKGMGGQQPQQQAAQPANPKFGPDGKPLPDVTQRGQNPGTTKFAIQAIQSLQGLIAEATDPQEIGQVRQCIAILTQIVQKDQQSQQQQGPTMNPLQ